MMKRPSNAAQRAGLASFLFATLILCVGVAVRASELQATKDFADVANTVKNYVAEYGAEHVLLALDIDNTIMSMDSDLGSDHWFEWQNYLLKNEPTSPHLVAKTFPELLKVQGILYDRGTMHATQSDEPRLIGELQKQGIATIVVTSRGPEFRVPTERELKRCGYDFKATALAVTDVPAGEFKPLDPAKPEKSGLSAEEVKKYNLESPKPVLYTNGVFMTAGQHKGMMLITLLNQTNRNIKAIVYADDNVRHVGSVFSAAVARNIEVSTFHFQHEETLVQKFQFSDKANMDAQWAAIRDGGKVVSVSKPEGEKPALQVERAPVRCGKPVNSRRFRLFHHCQ
jgi:hypothetical protein